MGWLFRYQFRKQLRVCHELMWLSMPVKVLKPLRNICHTSFHLM